MVRIPQVRNRLGLTEELKFETGEFGGEEEGEEAGLRSRIAHDEFRPDSSCPKGARLL
jgi:hypothetical protein